MSYIKRYWRSIGVIALVGLSIFSNWKAFDNADDLRRESAERRDQACQGYEAGHNQEIVDLKRTYSFYVDPPPEFKNLLSDPRAIDGLRESVRDAKVDTDQYGVFVPVYCDEPGFGRPEPDPKVPKPPESVKKLLVEPAASPAAEVDQK